MLWPHLTSLAAHQTGRSLAEAAHVVTSEAWANHGGHVRVSHLHLISNLTLNMLMLGM